MKPIPAVQRLAVWRKSSHSQAGSGDCVEVANARAANILVRDSKDPSGPVLTFNSSEWAAFIAAAKASDFNATG
ncbi:DUF397 domain-containing protein [Actinomadura sp. 6N118]|uniref:DUF397 domain-containing protein n=1 Tax=Actinomadura sp. 6N118 TaxID=3375151 RepID=UPI0037B5579B